MAPDLFLEPMDWIMDRTVHFGLAGISIGSQVFTDLDCADDVAVLSEMLEKFYTTRHVLLVSRLTGTRPRSNDPPSTRPIPRQ